MEFRFENGAKMLSEAQLAHALVRQEANNCSKAQCMREPMGYLAHITKEYEFNFWSQANIYHLSLYFQPPEEMLMFRTLTYEVVFCLVASSAKQG